MKRLWTASWMLVAAISACRGTYIGIEDCDDTLATGGKSGSSAAAGSGGAESGGKPGQAAGGTPGEVDGEGGRGGAPGGIIDGGSGGSAGEPTVGGGGEAGAGRKPLCSDVPSLPAPSLYVSFDDCHQDPLKAKLNRPYYAAYDDPSLKDSTLWGFRVGNVNCAVGPTGNGEDLAADFSVSTGSIVFPGSPAYDLETDATISVWVRQSETHDAAAFGKWSSSDQFRLSVAANIFTFGAAFYPNGVQVEASVTSDTPVENGKWVRLVAVARRGDELALYQDGKKVGSEFLPSNFAFQFSQKKLIIGRQDEGAGLYFKGAIDELKIWRSSLSDAEVAALHCYN